MYSRFVGVVFAPTCVLDMLIFFFFFLLERSIMYFFLMSMQTSI